MGFFKNFQKAYKAANTSSASKSAPKKNSAPPPPKKQPVPTIDPADLTLPDEIATDKPGLTLKPTACRNQYEINIVGESYRQGNIKGIVNAAGGKGFDIYLVNDPNNAHDKSAVGVWAGGVQVGFIGKPTNKAIFKRVQEATEKGEVIWGKGRASSRSGEVYGVFGSVYMDNFIAPNEGSVTAKELKPAALAKAIEAGNALASSEWPDTVAQAKALAKKAVKAAVPLCAHAMWVQETSSDEDEKALWSAVEDACTTIFDDAEEHASLADADDANMDSSISDLLESLKSASESHL